jgi:hypothetical protein
MADSAADAAAEAAAATNRASTIELWTLYSIGVLVTVLRTYARVKAVGFKNLRADDYIVWFSIVLIQTESTPLSCRTISLISIYSAGLLYSVSIGV